MKNGIRRAFTGLSIIFIAAASIACRIENQSSVLSGTGTGRVVSLAIQSGQSSMAPGTTLQLEATGRFSGNAVRSLTREVAWDSADPAIATVNSSGLVISELTSSGSTTITASSGGMSASTVITISPIGSMAIIPGNATISPGTEHQVSAIATLQNSAMQDVTRFVTWDSTNTGIAAVSPSGVVTAFTNTTGSSTLSAVMSGISGTANLTSAPVVSLSVTPDNISVVRGETLQFRARGTFENNGIQDMTRFSAWSALPETVLAVGGNGLAVAVAPGQAVVTATFGPVSGSAAVRVIEPALISIALTPVNPSVTSGTSLQFTALGTFSDGVKEDITPNVTWNSSNNSVAVISNAPETKGIATAIMPGSSEITAQLLGIRSRLSMLLVTGQTNTGQANTNGPITVLPFDPSIRVGNGIQFRALRVSPDGTVEDLTASAVWSSSNNQVAFVSQGFATGLNFGATIISAAAGSFTGHTVLTVGLFDSP